MDTRQNSFVDICDRSDMDELLRDLSHHSNTTLTIDIANETDALVDPGEFEHLSRAAQTHAVDIELITDDPIRQELARIFGVRAFASSSRQRTEVLKSGAIGVSTDRNDTSQTRRIIERTEEITLAPTEDFDLSTERLTSGPREASEASFSFVTASAEPGEYVYGKRTVAHRVSRNQQASRSIRAASLVVSGALIVGAIVALLLALLAPTVAITITPEVQEISSEVSYGLAGTGVPLDVAIEPRQLTESIAFEASVPTTGMAVLPDEPARGLIFLTNPHTERILVPEGTSFGIEGHAILYQSLSDVEIPAADPFASATFGTAVVGIEAIEPGPDGNLDVGILTGTLESGILFQNRFPLEGGSMKNVAVVAKEDLRALQTSALDGLQNQVSEAFVGLVPAGWEFVERPAMAGEPSITFSGEEGMESAFVSIRAEAAIAASIFDPAELELMARESLQGRLATAVPEGYGLLVESVHISAPAVAGPNIYDPRTMRASAQTEAQLDQATIDQLRRDIVGMRESQAFDNLQQVAGISDFSLSYGPDWLPWEPIPRFPNRVSIDVNGS